MVDETKAEKDAAARGGSYITWEGLSKERNNRKATDILSRDIEVKTAGTYRFVWAMRQPNDVASDKANDGWLNSPDAARFGC